MHMDFNNQTYKAFPIFSNMISVKTYLFILYFDILSWFCIVKKLGKQRQEIVNDIKEKIWVLLVIIYKQLLPIKKRLTFSSPTLSYYFWWPCTFSNHSNYCSTVLHYRHRGIEKVIYFFWTAELQIPCSNVTYTRNHVTINT